jgi:thymidylate kinase
MYIVLEGIVGSGKTTQVKKLVEYFTSSPNPFSFREGGKKQKSLLLQERARVRYVREP